ncbi:MAG: GGDEF domain-containing protein, partial [Myxococcota bacterium]
SKVQTRYKDMLARERGRAEELERQVTKRTEELAEALKEVTRLSRTDPLTGLLNRRAFSEQAEQALRVADRHERSAALLMCDLDFFKKLNDSHGHQAGDRMLAAAAKVFLACVREIDIVGRYGGEEFIILLTETPLESVPVIAERILHAVRSLPASEIVGGRDALQTVSIGISIYPSNGDDLEELIEKADKALYAAKDQGRDRAILVDDLRAT